MSKILKEHLRTREEGKEEERRGGEGGTALCSGYI
jgi:hypothetical protein